MNLPSHQGDDSKRFAALDGFEIPAKSEKCLFSRIRHTLSRYHILHQIYDAESVTELVRSKYDNDNYPLWLLASHDELAYAMLKRIDAHLENPSRKERLVLVELYVPRGNEGDTS